jgi:D-amino-acid dehydrogenase
MGLHVAVIGAGIVGACAAHALLDDGHRVTLIEPDAPGGPQAASYGNGCWLSPMSVIPVSTPGLWRQVPRMLADPLGPLAIRWAHLPRLAPWLVRFLRAGATEARVAATARALRPLIADAPARHAALAAAAGVPELIERRGLMYVYPTRADFMAEAMAWRIRADVGVRWTELDAAALRAREPALDGRYGFAVLVEEGGHCRDPGGYVAALARHAVARGAELRRARARGFRVQGRRLFAVVTDDGEIACHRAVICAGVHSGALARAAGDAVPLESERGYHAVVTDTDVGPETPMMPSDGKMSITRTTGGLRCAGQVELASVAAAPDWQRAAILRDHLLRSFPALPRDLPADRVRFWMGHRPSIADGRPVIGPARATPDVLHAFGHGHIGLVAAPGTAAIVADLVAARAPSIPQAPFGAERFR